MGGLVNIIISGLERAVSVEKGGNLLSGLLRNKVEISNGCGGMGTCTTCRVIVLAGNLHPRTEIEQERAEERKFKDNERLSCQCSVSSDLNIEIPGSF